MRKRRRKKCHAQDGDGKTELRGKGKYEPEDIWGIKLDGVPVRGIDVRGGLGMHVQKGVTGR